MPKAQYGIDAPPVIIGLFIAGLSTLFSSFAVFFYLNRDFWSLFLGYLFLIDALFCLAMAILMIYSSKKGKIQQIEQWTETLKLKGNEQILDVGCGRGVFLNTIAKKLKSGKAIGIDIWQNKDQSNNSKEATLKNARAENVLKFIEVQTTDMRDLPFKDHSFDHVVSCLALHNLPNREDRLKSLKEMMRVLKKDGSLFLVDFQCTKEYFEDLEKMGYSVFLSKRHFKMFPPVRYLRVSKIRTEESSTFCSR